MEFEILYEELARGAEIIPALVSGVSQAEAQIKPDLASWSILEVICHLADEEREDFREHLDLIVNRPNDPWKRIDPQGWVTARKYNERDLAASLDDFAAERRRTLEWLKGLSAANWDAGYTNNFGTMTAGSMFASWVAHDNLHMRQLVELRRARIVRIAAPYDVGYAGDW
jgi:hypothetical protein